MRRNTISCKPNLKLHAKSPHEFEPYTAKSERAYLDWYFCDPESESYPIRNVSKLGKLEPHYEDLTFNACASCNQMMLNSAINKGIRYIFFFTKYVGNKNKIDRTYFITGFYEINKVKYVKDKKRKQRKAVKAKTNAKFLDINNAIKLQSIGINIYNARHAPKYLSEKQVKSILKKFKKSKWYYGKQIQIPEDWNVTTMKELCKLRQGLQIPISERFKENDSNRLKYITVKSIHSDTFDEYIENPGKRVMCNEDDILFTRTGNTGEIITNIKGVFHNNFFLIDFDRKLLSKEYLIYFLRQKRIQEIIMSLAGATTIPDLNHGDFFRLLITIPPDLKEQQKIASILINANDSIQKTTEQIEKSKQLKTGLMQKLLTKGIDPTDFRKVKDFFKKEFEIPKKWNYPKFSKVVQINSLTKTKSEFASYVPMDAVNTDSRKVDYLEKRKVKDFEGLPRFIENDVLFARITPSTENGKTALMEDFQNVGIASSELTILRPGPEVLPRYLFYYVKSYKVRQFAISQMLGTTNRQRVPEIVFEKDLNFVLPSIPEQQKIVSILSNVDSQIESLESKKSQLQKTKRGLMQKLLTGKIRVPLN